MHFNAITALPPAVRQRLLARLATVHSTLETYIEQGISASQFRNIPPVIVIQLLTGALNAAMDLDGWQTIQDIDQSAGDYLSVFFCGLAASQPYHSQS